MGLDDIREDVAKYYDLAPHHPNDIPFYLERTQSRECRILELGCGTGRVSLPLAEHCSFLHGVDHSRAMLEACKSKLESTDLDESRVQFSLSDISEFDLDARFDLIIAPFRVIQNLETDLQFDGLLRCVARHLSDGGRCILNVFRPSRGPSEMLSSWASPEERLAWEVETDDGRVACYDRRTRVQPDPLVVYPELTYRRFVGAELADEAVLKIAMRCFYPAEFLERIESAGFTVLAKWGGYDGEEYGIGSELVVEFALDHLEEFVGRLTGDNTRARRSEIGRQDGWRLASDHDCATRSSAVR